MKSHVFDDKLLNSPANRTLASQKVTCPSFGGIPNVCDKFISFVYHSLCRRGLDIVKELLLFVNIFSCLLIGFIGVVLCFN